MTDTTTQELAVLEPLAGVIDPEGLLAPMHGGWWSRQYPGRVNRVAILEDDALSLWTDWARKWIEQWCRENSGTFDTCSKTMCAYEIGVSWQTETMQMGARKLFYGPSLAHALAAAIGQLKEKT